MKVLRRWHPRTFTFAGEPLRLELKALQKAEAADFLVGMQEIVKGAPKPDEEVNRDRAVAMLTLYDTDFVRETFRKAVRPGEPMEDEDGRPITSGDQIFDLVTTGFVQAVLLELQGLCVTSEAEGKGSGSPSTSPSASAGSTASPAPSTGSEGCTSPSTATAPREGEPSSPPA
jgi:hypothetical protein